LTKDAGPVAANHAAKTLRAAYMGAAREDTSLPRDRHPCTSVEYNVEEARQVGITDWKAWRKAWDKIPNPTRRAYHLFALLSGVRPGEGARVRWDGLSAKRRTLTIKKSKSGLDVTIPLSLPLCRVLRSLPRPRRGYVFPARGPKGHIVRFDSDGLPVYANGLRHTYTSIAAAVGVDQLTIDMLTTHQPRGMSQKYFLHMIVVSGPAMRKAQARISAEIIKRAGIAPGSLLGG
jgi:integrase